ncbi:MAG: GntR family transcriptional regulator [Candidatus Rokubacteria bacterium]|nr:GntR family transcriptional regulator [Candidatus Rokubacteria bacterium]MBI2494130.1 GntR family transcriptional regulator [Candidatus Rokubacteria bacterium]MBI4627883.1 GntR family transcriptional regulator [Candidatus Rokubacteria bacterium]
MKNRRPVRSAPLAKIGRASLDRPLPPLYYRVSRTLEQRIRDQHSRVGDRLPSEDDLCREFGASRITIRQAVGRLVEQGLIVRRRGSGSFVSAVKEPRAATPSKFTGALEDLFAEVKAVRTKSAEIVEEVPPAEVRVLLGLGVQETVAVVRRVRTFRDRIFSLSTNYLPRSLGAQLSESELYQYPLLQLLEEKLHVTFRYADQTVEARLADEDVARALDVNFGDPVLFVERLMFAEAARPVEVVRSYYRADVYRYQIRLVRSRKAPFHWRLHDDVR